MEKLKRCPFCGYEAVIETMKVRKGYEADVHCNSCSASIHTITYDTEQEAEAMGITDWNKRINEAYKIHSEAISKLNSCNDCAISKICPMRPKLGEYVRINCFLWSKVAT